MAHWLHKSENAWWERVIQLLGLKWTKEDMVQALSDKSKTQRDGVFLPLSFVIQPQMPDVLKKILGSQSNPIGDGSYWPTDNEEVVDLSELDKDTFKQIIGAAGSLAPMPETKGDK